MQRAQPCDTPGGPARSGFHAAPSDVGAKLACRHKEGACNGRAAHAQPIHRRKLGKEDMAAKLSAAPHAAPAVGTALAQRKSPPI
ncbi:hypothetical protein GCM10017653_00960 [Ancylobacter defluvii]|uniref:Uncharacterized protein n=1 Tax=Ancylobacter defluvii TaxID=1282440 RepID=A0A9W6JRM7_9HYPH|nr:hypothetical protein GCM10017653_00960 [Ancylobacter defluvii]